MGHKPAMVSRRKLKDVLKLRVVQHNPKSTVKQIRGCNAKSSITFHVQAGKHRKLYIG